MENVRVEDNGAGGQNTKCSESRAGSKDLQVKPPIPPADQYLHEGGYNRIRNAKFTFEDMSLADAAAGFISFRPITMLFRRWPFRCFMMLVAMYFTIYTLFYLLGLYKLEVEGPFDLTPIAIANGGGTALLCWAAPILAIAGCPRAATLTSACAFAFVGLVSLFVFVLPAVLEDNYFFAWWSFIHSFIQLNMAYTFALKEQWVWPASLFDSVLILVSAAALVPVWGIQRSWSVFGAVLWCLMAVSFLVWRRRSLKRAELASKPDKQRYDEVWKGLKADNELELRRLAEVVNAWRHIRVMQPWLSLEEIYQKGYSLNGWYQEVIEVWARACGARACPAPVKSLHRTLEKIHRSYKGRIPPVIDIVRSTIVVDEIQNLQQVLEHVLRSSHVHCIKNRFDLTYDAEHTAGYRDLNLQITFKELIGTVFQGFIFELQIHLAPILAVKTEEGHNRYIRLRNLRGD